jgi:RHS repeat-associated protein
VGWTTFATGTTAAVSGTFDPTLVLNGFVSIRLTGGDTSGRTAATTVMVVVTRNLKIGNFTVSFNDLSVPVAGLPIQIVRTYDSRNQRGGDFGVGWTLGLSSVAVTTNGDLGDNWVLTSTGGAFANYCVQESKPHIVTVTFVDGTTYQFQPSLSGQCQQVSPPTQVTINFTPKTSTGTTPPNAGIAIVNNQLLTVSQTLPGPVVLYDDNAVVFHPDQYKPTLPDGRTMLVSEQSGLQSFTDLNGNTLTITPGGITHSSGKTVTFLRDGLHRITKITDPGGNNLLYGYNIAGDLVSYKDAANNQSTYTYNPNHGLLTIVDPSGHQPIRNDYDASGRLVSHTDAYGNVINYTNNPGLSQEIVTDRLGNVTVNQYDASGNIVKVTDPLGGVTTRVYDANGNTTQETNPLGEIRKYTYDPNNNRLTEMDPLLRTTTYTYNNRNQVLTITDAMGRVTTNVYDPNGNLLTTQDPLHNTTTSIYNTNGTLASRTDAMSGVTSYLYDASGNPTKQTDALGNVITYNYDNNGNKMQQSQTRTTSSGTVTMVTSYLYDGLNRLIKTTYADGSTTQIQYNAIGKQAVTIDQLNHQTSYQYDLMGRLLVTTYPDGTTESSTYDAEGHRVSSTDRGSRTTTYQYDGLARLTKTTYPDGASTTTNYDAAGEVMSVTDALGNTTQYQYDLAGRRTKVIDALGHATSFTYDSVGNQQSMQDANNNTTQYTYDNDNRRTKVTYPDSTTDLTNYDALGRTTSKTDQAGVTTQYQFDKLGRLLRVTDALSQITSYTYDEVGNRLNQTDANLHTTSFAYDNLGRRIKRTLPLGMSETLTYDAAGNLKTKIDFNAKTTSYNYDLGNRLTTKTPDASFAAPTISFSYTATGQRLSMVDASGTTNYVYDLRDHLKSKATPQGTLSYTYDNAGNLLSLGSSNTNGVSVNYAYDALNRLFKVTDNRLTAGTTTYSYDLVGNLQNYLYPNGVQTAFQYNALNRLTNLTIAKGGALASYAYQLGAAGNRIQVTELGGRQVNYTYDSLYRLKTETIAGTASANGAIGYNYDPVGNRLSRTSTVTAVPASTSTFDANDRLASDTYDADGNTTASGGNTFLYDFENHLTSQNAGAVSIVYDGDGNRVSKTVGGNTTKYLVDDRNLTGYAQVVEELVAGTVQRSYTYGLHRISQSQAATTSFYGYDGHGNVRLLTDSTGSVTDRYDFDAFGITVGQSGATSNVYLYSGEQNDPNLNLYYLRARYLNQFAGRFWTMDSYEGDTPPSFQKYSFAGADPVNNSDPSGDIALPDLVLTSVILNEFPIKPFLGNLQGVKTKVEEGGPGNMITTYRIVSGREGGGGAYFRKPELNAGEFRPVDATGISTFEIHDIPANKPYALGYSFPITPPKQENRGPYVIPEIPVCSALYTPNEGEGKDHWSVKCVTPTDSTLSTYAKIVYNDAGLRFAPYVIANPAWMGLPKERRFE